MPFVNDTACIAANPRLSIHGELQITRRQAGINAAVSISSVHSLSVSMAKLGELFKPTLWSLSGRTVRRRKHKVNLQRRDCGQSEVC